MGEPGITLCRCGRVANDVVPGGDPICGPCSRQLARTILKRAKLKRRRDKLASRRMAVVKGRR
jgi:hypothetical protein